MVVGFSLISFVDGRDAGAVAGSPGCDGSRHQRLVRSGKVLSRLINMVFGAELPPTTIVAAAFEPLVIAILLLSAPSVFGAIAFSILRGFGLGSHHPGHGATPPIRQCGIWRTRQSHCRRPLDHLGYGAVRVRLPDEHFGCGMGSRLPPCLASARSPVSCRSDNPLRKAANSEVLAMSANGDVRGWFNARQVPDRRPLAPLRALPPSSDQSRHAASSDHGATLPSARPSRKT